MPTELQEGQIPPTIEEEQPEKAALRPIHYSIQDGGGTKSLVDFPPRVSKGTTRKGGTKAKSNIPFKTVAEPKASSTFRPAPPREQLEKAALRLKFNGMNIIGMKSNVMDIIKGMKTQRDREKDSNSMDAM